MKDSEEYGVETRDGEGMKGDYRTLESVIHKITEKINEY